MLRKLEPRDAEIVLEYLQIVGGETDFLLFDETGLGVDLEQERVILEQTFNDPISLLLGCFIEDEIIAISNLSVKERLRINHIATIGLSVKKSWWNKGIGSEILKYFIGYSLENKQIKIIRLDVRTDNLKAINMSTMHDSFMEEKE